MEKDRFDIEAKAETTGKAVSQDQMRLMVQSLLEDRFKLKVHRETRELSVYNMVLEKNGPKMKMSGDQTATTASPDAPRGVALMTGEQTPSGTMLVFFGNAVSLSKLAGTLQGMVQRPIIDKTNVKGLFDFRIRFSPSLMPAFPEETRPEDATDVLLFYNPVMADKKTYEL